jgi:hypothetical protein
MILTDFTLPWVENTMESKLQTYTFCLFCKLILTSQGMQTIVVVDGDSCLECLFTRLVSDSAKNLEICIGHNMLLSYPTQFIHTFSREAISKSEAFCHESRSLAILHSTNNICFAELGKLYKLNCKQ